MKTSELTKQIINYCTIKGHYAVRVNNIPSTKYRAGNVTKGVADIMGCTKDGKALAIEIKNKDTKDRQSEYQKEFEAHYKSRGGIYIIATTLDDVIKNL